MIHFLYFGGPLGGIKEEPKDMKIKKAIIL